MKINKYQEALDKLRDKTSTEVRENYKDNQGLYRIRVIGHKNKECDTLQELVDKETPMKPIREEYVNTHGYKEYGYSCGKCKRGLLCHCSNIYRCEDTECNQVIDWSEEEWNYLRRKPRLNQDI